LQRNPDGRPQGVGRETAWQTRELIAQLTKLAEELHEQKYHEKWQFELPVDSDKENNTWSLRRKTIDVYELYLTGSAPWIVMTGSAVSRWFSIPFMHKWLKLGFRHTTNLNVADYQPVTVDLSIPTGSIPDLTNMKEQIYYADPITLEVFSKRFLTEEEEYPANTVYSLSLTAANTTRVHFNAKLKRLT